MAGMIGDAEAFCDQIGDALKRPQLGRIAMSLRTLQQSGCQLMELFLAQARLGARRDQLEGFGPFLAIACAPLADGGAAHADTASDFGIGQVALKERQGFLAEALNQFAGIRSRHTS